MRRWLVLLMIGLVPLIGGCQPASPTPTPQPPTVTPLSVTPPPTSTFPPTWTPVPVTPSPTRPPRPTPTETGEVPTAPPTPTEHPGCAAWRMSALTNQEEFEAGETPLVLWPAMLGAGAYRFTLRDPSGRQIHSAVVAQPEPGERTLRYEIAPEILRIAAFGFGWEVSPIGPNGQTMCFSLSGEFSYVVEASHGP